MIHVTGAANSHPRPQYFINGSHITSGTTQETITMTLYSHCSAIYPKRSLHNIKQIYKVGVPTGF